MAHQMVEDINLSYKKSISCISGYYDLPMGSSSLPVRHPIKTSIFGLGSGGNLQTIPTPSLGGPRRRHRGARFLIKHVALTWCSYGLINCPYATTAPALVYGLSAKPNRYEFDEISPGTRSLEATRYVSLLGPPYPKPTTTNYAPMGDPTKRDHLTFSTRRRKSPGVRLTENLLDIALAAILWVYEIRPPIVNGAGMDIDLSDKVYADAGFTMPKPFAARFILRTENRLRILKDQWEIKQNGGYELRGILVDVDGMMQL
ncbi:cytochrome P450 CYP2 subfamily [Penicillium samsonianum]|uniref:cytochrome P450 CYP2 subfamily n=1 Tax=Penicillium samsonianum TaxID=1882272 RepID=UPI0025476536|nr:cytochrome P450 CYP2 subfamily [Penicillium samsonianum]KAJ6128656.1 cytochrome P450 CYP2 subfamily [Penicillium samsonianum]